jgi:pimeloyl-ACP methyl ester carboxylesterase
VEKWRAWTDPAGDVERHFSRDLLLANVTLYWVTATANAANRSYYERARETRRIATRIAVPTGVALTTEPIQCPPRERVERSYADIRRWVRLPRGGHFVAAEAPEVLAEELRAFFRPFRSGTATRPS